MKKFISLIFLALVFLASPAAADYFTDVIITGTSGIWTDERAYSTIDDAVTDIGSDEQTLLISREVSTTSLTIPSNVKLRFVKEGAIDNSGQLTINTKDIAAENRQIFTGTGAVDFVGGSVVRSAWFEDIVEAIDETYDDNLVLIISEEDHIDADCTVGTNVTLKWEGPSNHLIADSGCELSNIGKIEAGDYQLFAGEGDFDFRDGTRLSLDWFNRLRSVTAWIENERVALVVARPSTVSYDNTAPSNMSIEVKQGGALNVDAGRTLTVNGSFTAGLYQVFGGDGSVVFDNSNASISPDWYTGTDTEKVQWALDTARASNRAAILIHRVYIITSSVMYDDTIVAPGQYIIAIGNGGFYTDQAIDIFSTNTVITTSPTQNGLVFKGISFESDAPATAAYAVDGDAFLRIAFINCSFKKIRCAYTENYFQSWIFSNCKIFDVDPYFMYANPVAPSTHDGLATDIHFHNCLIENGTSSGDGGLIKVENLVGSSFVGNLYEGSLSYPFISTVYAYGLEISGNYFEDVHDYTTGATYATRTSGRVLEFGHRIAAVISGNWFGDAAADGGYEIWLETAFGNPCEIVSQGNYIQYNYINNDDMTWTDTWGIVSDGDVSAFGVLFSEPYLANRDRPRQDSLILADDTATTINVSTLGTITIATQFDSCGGIFNYRSDASKFIITLGTPLANTNTTTGILTGTTGVDGKTTVSVHTDGTLYIENRMGTDLWVKYSNNQF